MVGFRALCVLFRILFIYFWLSWVFVAACGLSLDAVRDLLMVLVRRRLLLQIMGSRVCGLQRWWYTGLVTLRHVESSQS